MKLDRNINADGHGKYALVKLRRVDEITKTVSDLSISVLEALKLLRAEGILDYGATPETEFFLIRLKDKYAAGALHTYASYAVRDGEVEYGQEVMEMAKRSGEWHPNCKKPD